MSLSDLLTGLPGAGSLAIRPRPYSNHSVELKRPVTAAQRAAALEQAGLNVFFYPAELVSGCDLLSDSGTTTMTNRQWAALHLGDESYGSNRGYFELLEQVRTQFGEGFAADPTGGLANAFFFHQGRAAEDALFTALASVQPQQVIPSNGHFDTTQANIEANGMTALNLFARDLQDPLSGSHFKGNIDLERLERMLAEHGQRIPVVYLTVTNNTGGGQPVAMANVQAVSRLAHRYGVPFFLDACRFAENAWFIRRFEPGYAGQTIEAIVREMFSYVDGFTISFKKDGLANMGGGLFLRSNGLFVEKYPHLPETLMSYQITREGHPSYGGMSGRDIMALVEGLRTVTRLDYLDYRIGQVQAFGQAMQQRGLPVLAPFGGHAVYLDMNAFFAGTAMTAEGYGGIGFAALLLAAYGHRVCELGHFAFGVYDRATGKDSVPEVNFVRFAVPRLRYEQQDLQNVAEAAQALYEHRRAIRPVRVTYGRELPLRHFKARFAFA